MNIITKEHLIEPALKEIIEPLYKKYVQYYTENQHEEIPDFDSWVYENLKDLGYELYSFIGNQYGYFDDAIEELLP